MRLLQSFLLVALCAFATSAVAASGFAAQHIAIGTVTRDYLLREPVRAASSRGLVILLHGHGGSAAGLVGDGRARAAPYRRWQRIADEHGLVLVAPDGAPGRDGRRGWNDCRADAATNPDSDDVAFLDALVADAVAHHGVDARRVYVVGTSNGGQMALRYAIERPQRVAGVAAIVAAMPSRSECATPSTFVPVLVLNGDADPLLPWAGGTMAGRGERGTVQSADASIAVWRALGGFEGDGAAMTLPDREPGDRSRIDVRRWPATGTARVALYRVVGGGHSEPSASERYARWYQRLTGPQNADIESAEEIWRFFAQLAPDGAHMVTCCSACPDAEQAPRRAAEAEAGDAEAARALSLLMEFCGRAPERARYWRAFAIANGHAESVDEAARGPADEPVVRALLRGHRPDAIPDAVLREPGWRAAAPLLVRAVAMLRECATPPACPLPHFGTGAVDPRLPGSTCASSPCSSAKPMVRTP